MAAPWTKREPVTAYESALQMCAFFAKACKDQGDAENYFRWKNVLWQYSPKGTPFGEVPATSAMAEVLRREIVA